MTQLEILKQDLETHLARRTQLADNKGGHFIKRAGHPISGVIASYDTIIASIEKEIAELEAKAAARKKPQGKKTTQKKTTKKKTAKK